MSILNEPTGGMDDDSNAEWTPAIGIRRAVCRGLIAAAILAAIFMLPLWFLPRMFTSWIILVASGFLTGWVMLGVIERAAGMQMLPLTISAFVVAVLIWVVDFSLFAAFATMPTTAGPAVLALSPAMLIAWSYPIALGAAAGAVFGHYGASAADIGDLVMHNPLSWGDRG